MKGEEVALGQQKLFDQPIRNLPDPYLLAVLAVSAGLGMYQLSWGLPNGNYSWAADALGPLTVLSIAQHSFGAWNSGWFYFKYPLGYPLLLLASYVPYLGALVLTGRFRHPTASYPYGFSNPESALYLMALSGRVLNVAMVVATVALTYGIGRRLVGRTAARLAGFFVLTAYPVVYYAHTTNLYVPSLFWLMLALWSTVVALQSDSRWPGAVLGIAAAMSVSTKEQDLPFLAVLPLMVIVSKRRTLAARLGGAQVWRQALWNAQTRATVVAALITGALANNLLLNPRGALNRVLNLTGHKLPGVTARLTPVEFAFFKGWPKELMYGRQLVDRMESTLGLPLFVVAVVGIFFVLRYRSRAAVCLLGPAAAYYFFALRTHATQIALRYAVPLIPIFALCAAVVCAAAMAGRWRRLATVGVAGLCLLGLARAVELDLLLRHDARYQAEAWINRNVKAGSVAEVYQKPTYLPRLPGFDVREVPLPERTIDGVGERHPDVIIISSAAKMGITHHWNADWRQGNTLVSVQPEARAFLDALENGRLPYRRVAQFSQHPVLLRLLVTSLCPEISVFERVPLGDHHVS